MYAVLLRGFLLLILLCWIVPVELCIATPWLSVCGLVAHSTFWLSVILFFPI